MVPILVFVVTFALNNKHPMNLNLWPFGIEIEFPIYLGLFAALIAGALLGGVVAWMGQGRVRSSLRGQVYDGEVARRALKTEAEKVKALENELKILKSAAVEAPKTELKVIQETLPPQKRSG